MQHTDAREVALGHAALSLTELLDREMDAIFHRFLEEIQEPESIQRQRAAAANRIVLLCRGLAGELHRYEHLRWLLDHDDDDKNEDDDLDF